MQIQSAAVSLNSQHQFEHSEHHTRLRIERPSTAVTAPPIAPPIDEISSQVDFSFPRLAENPNLARIEELAERVMANIDATTSLLKALVEILSGKKFEDTAQFTPKTTQTNSIHFTQPLNLEPVPAATPTLETVTYSTSLIREYEESNVAINAQLLDSDGRQLDINLNIMQQRRYEEVNADISIRQGPLTDPLVINFNGRSAQLSPETTEFDLNSDGDKELIPTLNSGSAYIALDKNGDGIINNGSELFGPDSGNGFTELAQYDEDGNGLIDSGDAIFSQLLAFNPAQATTTSLQSMGVGALYLNAVTSPFRLTDNHNVTLGEVRSTSFYVTEDGQAGTLQQIDLAV